MNIKWLPVLVLIASISNAAFAGASACVLFVQNDGNPVTAQGSCDGADLTNLFEASGISAAISRGIPYFLDKGYSYAGCTDSHSEGSTGVAYSRCVFLKL